MKHLWAPWRIDYVLAPKEENCIFCYKPKEDNDRQNLILHRAKRNFIILNLYPYTSGHVMVVPYRHTDEIGDLDSEEISEMVLLAQKSANILKECFKPHGLNIGMNLGTAGGAGIEEHIHMHILPRWNGDTNFISTLGDARVLPQSISATYDELAVPFAKL